MEKVMYKQHKKQLNIGFKLIIMSKVPVYANQEGECLRGKMSLKL